MDAVLLIAHGTVERLDDLPRFLANIRRGQPAPEALVREVLHKYEAIGGKSPLLETTRALARKVETALGTKTRVAMRLWDPYPKEVLAELVQEGVTRVIAMPLAQHSAAVYGGAVKDAAKGMDLEIVCAENWGRAPSLVQAYASSVREALAHIPKSERRKTGIVMTAHSLPMSVIEAGDPYADLVCASADDIAASIGDSAPPHVVAFQSQGMSGPGVEWLGPTLRSALDDAKKAGVHHVVVAPIGFLADHVETLYDLDIEARGWADDLGLVLHRTAALNDSDALVRAVCDVAKQLLAGVRTPGGTASA
jgi:ferrochelatase